MERISFETNPIIMECVSFDDGGTIKLLDLCDSKEVIPEGKWEPEGPRLFVVVHSVDENRRHTKLNQCVGKRFRITIEEITEQDSVCTVCGGKGRHCLQK